MYQDKQFIERTKVSRGTLFSKIQSFLVVSPAAKLHGAILLVEGEILDIDGALALQDDGGKPFGKPRVIHNNTRIQTVEIATKTFVLIGTAK